MTSKSTKIIAAIFTGLIAAPVYAGGLDAPIMTAEPAPVVQAQPMMQAPGWGGLYLGAQAGTIGVDYEIEIDEPGFTGVGLFELDGKFYGVHVGYMHDIGNFVLGGEFDYDMINLDTSTVTTDVSTSTDIDSDGTIMRLKVRGGYNFDRFLPYFTAGLARLEVDDEGDGSTDTDGTFVGFGGVFKATNNILIGGEFLRHQFDDAFDSGLDFESDTFSLRASYRF